MSIWNSGHSASLQKMIETRLRPQSNIDTEYKIRAALEFKFPH